MQKLHHLKHVGTACYISRQHYKGYGNTRYNLIDNDRRQIPELEEPRVP